MCSNDTVRKSMGSDGTCVRHPHIFLRTENENSDVSTSDSCPECDNEFELHRFNLAQRRNELERKLRNVDEEIKDTLSSSSCEKKQLSNDFHHDNDMKNKARSVSSQSSSLSSSRSPTPTPNIVSTHQKTESNSVATLSNDRDFHSHEASNDRFLHPVDGFLHPRRYLYDDDQLQVHPDTKLKNIPLGDIKTSSTLSKIPNPKTLEQQYPVPSPDKIQPQENHVTPNGLTHNDRSNDQRTHPFFNFISTNNTSTSEQPFVRPPNYNPPRTVDNIYSTALSSASGTSNTTLTQQQEQYSLSSVPDNIHLQKYHYHTDGTHSIATAASWNAEKHIRDPVFLIQMLNEQKGLLNKKDEEIKRLQIKIDEKLAKIQCQDTLMFWIKDQAKTIQKQAVDIALLNEKLSNMELQFDQEPTLIRLETDAEANQKEQIDLASSTKLSQKRKNKTGIPNLDILSLSSTSSYSSRDSDEPDGSRIKDGSKTIDDYKEVKEKEVTIPSGDTGLYTGGVLENTDIPHGKGKMSFEGGKWTYNGEWANGLFHGSGKTCFENGDLHEGQYLFGKRNGRGVYKWNDGRVYDGMFSRDNRHGEGTYTYPNGDTYTGQFVHGIREGHGHFKLNNGGEYIGNWKEGMYHGSGTLTQANGRRFEGKFYNGRWLR